MNKRKYKINSLKNRIEKNIILTTKEFYLLKLFGGYWHSNRNTKKLIYYLEFINKEIDKNKIDQKTDK
jgi:hypothetical protein